MTEGTTMPAEREAIVRMAKGLTEAQKRALLPCATNRSILPKQLVKWTTKPGHRFQSLKLSNTGYMVRDYLKESTHE